MVGNGKAVLVPPNLSSPPFHHHFQAHGPPDCVIPKHDRNVPVVHNEWTTVKRKNRRRPIPHPTPPLCFPPSLDPFLLQTTMPLPPNSTLSTSWTCFLAHTVFPSQPRVLLPSSARAHPFFPLVTTSPRPSPPLACYLTGNTS
ncbi:hypothetical protein AMTRI_Chr02g222750 [Amborella trichopoda]